MSMEEASAILKRTEEDFVNEWSKTRMIMYSVFQSQSTKKITPQDIMKFPWEVNQENESLSKEEQAKKLEDLRQYALDLSKKMNNQDNG